jgi:hypothetical protein
MSGASNIGGGGGSMGVGAGEGAGGGDDFFELRPSIQSMLRCVYMSTHVYRYGIEFSGEEESREVLLWGLGVRGFGGPAFPKSR